MSSKVASIIVDRLIEKIKSEGRMPWQRPYVSPCMNWFSKHEYRGINKFLLAGGEYISPNQLKKYNEKNNVNFWFESGTPYDIAVFYSVTEKELTSEQVQKYNEGKLGYKVKKKEDKLVRVNFILKYHRIYNIMHIKDKDGNKLQPRLGNDMIDEITPVDVLVDNYCSISGVGILEDGGADCYYLHKDDSIHTPRKEYFKSTEQYYRTLFHELIHSTGVPERLARSCYIDYHKKKTERSKEELVAEVGSLLLASECGFHDEVLIDNSENYVAGWCKWMKDNEQDVVNGMLAAEKAMQYILNGCQINNYDDEDSGAVVKIGD